jgi:hypothetical protein
MSRYVLIRVSWFGGFAPSLPAVEAVRGLLRICHLV